MSYLRDNLDKLLDLQKIDSDRDKTARAIRALDTGQTAKAALEAANAEEKRVTDELHKAHGDLKDAELELAGVEKKLKSYEDKVRGGTITNSREMVNMDKEIGQLIRQRASLDERTLSLMDQVEQLKVTCDEVCAKARQTQDALRLQMDKVAAQRDALNRTLTDLNAKQVSASKTVTDAVLLKLYTTIRERPTSAGLAVASVHDQTCTGCHMPLPATAADKTKEGAAIVRCENCGRILA